MYVAAIIAAGGRGVRLGADRPKQFLEIGGRSILELSVAALAASDRIHEIVVALPEDHVDAGGEGVRRADQRSRSRSSPAARAGRIRWRTRSRSRRSDADIDRDSRRGAAVRDRAT